MKSLFLFASLLLLASCGKEQFGTVAQTESTQTDGLKTFQQSSCSSHTLVKPKVDILYVVDNSESTTHMNNEIKSSIKKTVDSISTQFDFRVIGIPLLSDLSNTTNYQVLTNDATGIPHTSNRIMSSSEFNFFSSTATGTEAGLNRVYTFMNSHETSGLFRKSAYHLVILISNGRDTEIETSSFTNGETQQNTGVFTQRHGQLASLRTALQSTQFRLMSATVSPGCSKDGWLSSAKSYQAMSRLLYTESGAEDSNLNRDVYDLCASTGISNIFTAVNNSIKQVVVPHKYRYWPITFAENNETVDPTKVRVYKFSQGSAPVLMNSSEWTYFPNPSSSLATREEPTSGEVIAGKHFIKFQNLLTYPDCVQISSTSRIEYFGYVVIPRAPKLGSIVVRIGGQDIPSSALSYEGYKTDNIKVIHNGSTLTPEVRKNGYFIKITNPSYYYKSGDNVETFYTPDAI